MLFEKSKIQNFRGLAPSVMALDNAKIGNLGLITQYIVQNFLFSRFWRRKLHLDRWNMRTAQSFSNSLLDCPEIDWTVSEKSRILRNSGRTVRYIAAKCSALFTFFSLVGGPTSFRRLRDLSIVLCHPQEMAINYDF